MASGRRAAVQHGFPIATVTSGGFGRDRISYAPSGRQAYLWRFFVPFAARERRRQHGPRAWGLPRTRTTSRTRRCALARRQPAPRNFGNDPRSSLTCSATATTAAELGKLPSCRSRHLGEEVSRSRSGNRRCARDPAAPLTPPRLVIPPRPASLQLRAEERRVIFTRPCVTSSSQAVARACRPPVPSRCQRSAALAMVEGVPAPVRKDGGPGEAAIRRRGGDDSRRCTGAVPRQPSRSARPPWCSQSYLAGSPSSR